MPLGIRILTFKRLLNQESKLNFASSLKLSTRTHSLSLLHALATSPTILYIVARLSSQFGQLNPLVYPRLSAIVFSREKLRIRSSLLLPGGGNQSRSLQNFERVLYTLTHHSHVFGCKFF